MSASLDTKCEVHPDAFAYHRGSGVDPLPSAAVTVCPEQQPSSPSPFSLRFGNHSHLCFMTFVTTAGHYCADPGVPAGASRIGNTFGTGDTVKYICNNNLLLVGSSERVCQENGQWTGKEPACYCKTSTHKYYCLYHLTRTLKGGPSCALMFHFY